MSKTLGLVGLLTVGIAAEAACGAVGKFAPGSVTVGGEIGRRMEVTAEKILRHTDIDNVFVKPFRDHDAGTFGGFVGYGMLLDAVVKAAAHGVGGEEMRAFKTRRLKEIAATMTPDGRISMYADKPGFWDNHEQAYLIQALCLDHRVFGCAESLAAAERMADFLVRAKQPMTLGTESAFMALWRETGKDCYRKYLEETCRIRGDIGDYERHLKVNGVAHVYTWLARALGQVEYGKATGCVADVRGAADEAFRRMFSPMLSVSGTCTGSGGEETWGETWGDSQTGLGHWGETCASAYQMRLAGEMMTIEPDSRYGDLIERTLYNGFFAAQSPDGLNYRYWSPFNEKAEWYPRDTYCCPNNFKRMVFEIPDLVYFRADDGLYVNLYAPSELKAEGLKVVQRTSYPADGKVRFEFDFEKPMRVRFRVPRWTGSGEGWRTVSFPAGKSRHELDFAMKPRLVRGVHGQHGRAAVLVGPVVYGLSSAAAKEWEVRAFSETARYAVRQDFVRTGDVVKVVLEKSYVPGHVRDTRTLDFVRFSDPQRIRTYFAVAPECKTVPDELYGAEPSPDESPAVADVRKAVSADVVRPVRPGGVNGQAHWNGRSVMFLYPPSFDFKKVEGAIKYRYVLEDDARRILRFDADSPNETLASVWPRMQEGMYRLEVQAIGLRGRPIGLSGYRRFWKSAAFDPAACPKAVCGFAEAATKYYDWLWETPMVQSYLTKGVPYEDYVYSSYPCKTDGAIVRAFVTYAKMRPDRAEASLAVARRAADFLISLMLPEGSPLAHFPPTYRILKPTTPFKGKDFQADKIARLYGGQNMLVYPAMVASSFLDLHKAVGEAKYLEAAKKIAGTYVKLQGEDGTWHLKLNEKDGTPVAPNRLFPLSVCTLMERLYEITGESTYRTVADRGFAFVERGPLSDWNWEGQYEDVEPSRRFRNLTVHTPVQTAIYLLKRYPDDPKRRAQARECLRFAEDQFVSWKAPFRADGTGPLDEETPMIPKAVASTWFPVPGVFEQYDWYLPIDSAAGKMISGYLAFYRAEGRAVDLAKAKALGDAVTVMQQKHDKGGAIPTHWIDWEVGPSVQTQPWINCGISTANVLVDLAAIAR